MTPPSHIRSLLNINYLVKTLSGWDELMNEHKKDHPVHCTYVLTNFCLKVYNIYFKYYFFKIFLSIKFLSLYWEGESSLVGWVILITLITICNFEKKLSFNWERRLTRLLSTPQESNYPEHASMEFNRFCFNEINDAEEL